MSNKSNKLFIGISGKMCVGKSTITKLLINAIDNSTRFSVAKPLYECQDILYSKLGLTLESEKDRDLLIALGMWGRNKDPNFWLNQFVTSALDSDTEVIICDDVRFPNEADFFAKHGVLIRIDGEQRGANVDTSRATDSTETSLDEYPFKHIVSNSNSPEDMCKEIAEILMGNR